MRNCLLTLFASILAVTTAFSNGWNVRFEDGLFTDHFNCIEVIGETAICGTDYGLLVLDISTPETPVPISRFGLADGVKAFDLEDSLLYIAADEAGLVIFDVSNPRAPREIFDGIQFAPTRFVIIADTLAYLILDFNAGFAPLLIVDVSDPHHPEVISRTVVNGSSGVCNNGYLYIFRSGPMDIIDVQDPFQIFAVENPETTQVSKAQIEGDFMFANTGIFDVSEPESPELIRHFQTRYGFRPGPYMSLGSSTFAVTGNEDSTRLYLFDVRNPLTAVLRGSTVVHRLFGALAISGDYLWGANRLSTNDLIGYDISRLDQPRLMPGFSNRGNYFNLCHYGSYIYGRIWPGVQIIDASGSTLTVLDTLSLGDSEQILATENYLYVKNQSPERAEMLSIFDRRNPARPDSISSYQLPSSDYVFEVREPFVYLLRTNVRLHANLEVLDVSDPANPELVGSLTFARYGNESLQIEDNRLIVFFRNDDRICTYFTFDISDPGHPELIGQWESQEINNIRFEVSGHYLYSEADNESGIQVYDIADPNNFQIVNTIDNPLGMDYGTFSDEDVLVVGHGHKGVTLYSLVEPDNPLKIGYWDSPDYVEGATLFGEKLVVSSGSCLELLNIAHARNAWFFDTGVEEYDFGSVRTDRGGQWEFYIRNRSEWSQSVSRIECTGESFSFQSDIPIDIDPGDSVLVEVVFAPESDSLYVDEMYIFSGDVGFSIRLTGQGIIPNGIEDAPNSPFLFELFDAYPNPFNSSTFVKISLPASSLANLNLYDNMGRSVSYFNNNYYSAGVHRVAINGAVLPSGIYWLRLEQNGRSAVSRLVLVR